MATTCNAEANGMWLCRKAGETVPWDDQLVDTHLRSNGVNVGTGGVATGDDVLGPFVRVHVTDGVDPAPIVDTYNPPISKKRQAVKYLKDRYDQLEAKTVAQRAATPANENDLYAVLTVLRNGG